QIAIGLFADKEVGRIPPQPVRGAVAKRSVEPADRRVGMGLVLVDVRRAQATGVYPTQMVSGLQLPGQTDARREVLAVEVIIFPVPAQIGGEPEQRLQRQIGKSAAADVIGGAAEVGLRVAPV